MDCLLNLTPTDTVWGVVPVLTGPLQALLVMLPYLLLGLLAGIASLLKPSAIKQGLKLLWRLKFPVALLAAATGGVAWAAYTLWPESSGVAANEVEQGDDWPMFRGGPSRTGAVPDAPEPTRPGVNWVFKQSKTGFFGSPAVVGNRVYVSSATTAIIGGGSGEIYCFDADSGAVIWRSAPSGYRATFASPTVWGDYLVCGEGLHFTRDARVICLSLKPGHEGEVLWTYRTASHVECTPVIHEGHVYVGAGDDGYYCFRLEPDAEGQAQVVWHVPGENYPDAETSLVVHGGRVYAGLGLGGRALCVLDAKTGEELDRIDCGFPVFGPPAIVDGKLYVGMGNGDYVHRAEEIDMEPSGAVWCIDLATLEVDWKFAVGRTVLGAVAVADDKVFFGSRDGLLYCVGTDGKPRGEFNAYSPLVTSPAVGRRFVYAVADSGMLYVVDRETMELAWEFQVGTQPLLISSPAVARGQVYVGTQHDGFLSVGQAQREGEAPTALWPARLAGPGMGGSIDDTPLAELGAFHWQFPEDQMGETTEAMVAAPVAAVAGRLFVPLAGKSEQRGLACLPADAGQDATPKPQWLYPTRNGVYRSPVVSGETVFVVDGRSGDSLRELHAVDVAEGKCRWTRPVASDATGVMVCTEVDLFVQDGTRALTRFDLDGNEFWVQPLERLERAPTVAGSMVVAAVADPPSLVAMDRPTGALLWRVELDAPPTTSPLVHRSTILLGTSAGLEARSLVDGTLLNGWKMQPGGVASDLVIRQAKVAYITDQRRLLVVSRDDGSLLASCDGAIPSVAPLPNRGTLIFAGEESLMAFSPGQPEAKPIAWADISWLGRPATPMVLSNSNLYLGIPGWGLVRMGASQ